MPEVARALKADYTTSYSLGTLARHGVSTRVPLREKGEVSLLRLDARGGYEYWLGLHNFYVITRYNHSTYYAMAVHQLAQAIRTRHERMRRRLLTRAEQARDIEADVAKGWPEAPPQITTLDAHRRG